MKAISIDEQIFSSSVCRRNRSGSWQCHRRETYEAYLWSRAFGEAVDVIDVSRWLAGSRKQEGFHIQMQCDADATSKQNANEGRKYFPC